MTDKRTQSDKFKEAARELGADETINTSREDFSRRTWDLTDKQGADVVVDYNGQETWPSSIRATRRHGRLGRRASISRHLVRSS